MSRFCTVRIPKTWLDAAVYPVALDPTVDTSVSTSTDDASETAAGAVLTSSATGNPDDVDEWVGMRWAGFTEIASGSTITESYVTLYFYSASLDEPYHYLYGQHDQAPATFAETTNNISGRPRTTATCLIDNANWGAGSHNSPSCNSVIQEVLDAHGPLSSFVMLLTPAGSDATRDCGITLEDDTTNPAPAIHIVWTEC